MGARLITTSLPPICIIYLSLANVLYANGKDNYIFYSNKHFQLKKFTIYNKLTTTQPITPFIPDTFRQLRQLYKTNGDNH